MNQIDGFHEFGALAVQFSWFMPLMNAIPQWLLFRLNPGMLSFVKFKQVCSRIPWSLSTSEMTQVPDRDSFSTRAGFDAEYRDCGTEPQTRQGNQDSLRRNLRQPPLRLREATKPSPGGGAEHFDCRHGDNLMDLERKRFVSFLLLSLSHVPTRSSPMGPEANVLNWLR